jgi:hypothetical protein
MALAGEDGMLCDVDFMFWGEAATLVLNVVK